MKVVEFKLQLTDDQASKVDTWLNQLRWVWNEALRRVNEERQRYYRKQVNEDGTFGKVEDTGEVWHVHFAEGMKAYCCHIADKTRYADYAPCCEIRPYRHQQYANLKELKKWARNAATQKCNPDKPWLKDIPSCFSDFVARDLIKAWEQALSKTNPARYPRFKGNRDTLRSLTDENGHDHLRKDIRGKRNWLVKLNNKLGFMRIIGKHDRFPKDFTVVRICKRASGYYLQVTSKDLEDKTLKRNDRPVGIDVGLKFIVATDQGRVVEPKRYARVAERRLRLLQRKAARRRDAVQKLEGCKGKNLEKVNQQIALLHEKIKYRRRQFNHKLSTKLVREYGAIAVEKLQLKNLMRRPEPKLKENGTGYARNNAAAKSGLNKSFADAGLGQLLEMLKTKAEAAGRLFKEVDPSYTSQECSNCHEQVKKSLSTRTHVCPSCGFVEDRDVNAAKNILEKANFSSDYRCWDKREVKPASASSVEGQQESDSGSLDLGKELRAEDALRLTQSQKNNDHLLVEVNSPSKEAVIPTGSGLDEVRLLQQMHVNSETSTPLASEAVIDQVKASTPKPKPRKVKRCLQNQPEAPT